MKQFTERDICEVIEGALLEDHDVIMIAEVVSGKDHPILWIKLLNGQVFGLECIEEESEEVSS